MENLLKSKIIIYFALFGLAFSALLGIVSRNPPVLILIRGALSAFLMGALGWGLDVFLKRSLSEEDYANLLQVKREALSLESQILQAGVLEEQDSSPDISYESIYQKKDEKKADYETVKPKREEAPKVPVEKENGNFKEENFSLSPKISPVQNDFNDEKELDSKDELDRLEEAKKAEEARKKKISSETALKGTVRFRSGNKMITTESKIIAKAIKSILNKDQ